MSFLFYFIICFSVLMATVLHGLLVLIHRGMKIHFCVVQHGMTKYLIDFSRFERTPDDLLPLLWPGGARASGEYTHTSFSADILPKGLVRSLAGRFPWQPNPHPFLTQAGGEQQSADGLCSFNLVLCISL